MYFRDILKRIQTSSKYTQYLLNSNNFNCPFNITVERRSFGGHINIPGYTCDAACVTKR